MSREAITLLVATGAHRGNTEEENLQSFGQVAQGYKIINHNSEGQLARIGLLSNGCPLNINPLVAQADLVILTGLIAPHELAGFSGGRKSILPGVAGVDVIKANHALLTAEGIGVGRLEGNPVHNLMMEAMRLVKPDFILNVVADTNHLPAHVVAGDPEKAWLAGVDACRRAVSINNDYQAEVCFASAGGHPRDINLYQAVKPMRTAAKFLSRRGVLVVCAACAEGTGNPVFERWATEAVSPSDISQKLKQGFVLGGHKAYMLAELVQNYEVILISDWPGKKVRDFFMTPADNLGEAIELIKRKYGPNYRALIIPEAASVMPVP